MAGAIRAQIKLDGGKAFADDFNKAASAVKSANAQMGYFNAALEKNSKDQQAAADKARAVQSAFDAEQNVIDALTKRIEELSNMTGVDTTQAVEQLTAELYKHKTAQAQLGDQVDDTTEDFTEFGKEVGVASAIASKALDAAWAIGKKIFEIGKNAVMYNAEMETYSKTISAFFRTAGQGAEEAEANTAQLLQNQKELSAQIGLGADKLIDANKALIAAGVDGDRSQKAVEALAKSLVATGGGNEELSRMAANLQQIANNGKAAEADLKQFSNAGVNVKALVADNLGITNKQLEKMDITFDMIVDALDKATQEGGKFFEASQVGATTLQGQMNVLQSSVKEGLGTAFQPFNDALQNDILPKVQELVDGIDWEALGEMMADAAEVATEAFGVLANTVGEVAEAYITIKNAIEDWGNVSDRVSTDVSNNYLGTAGAFKKAYDEHERFASDAQVGMDTIIDKTSQVNKSIAHMPTTWTEAAPLAKNAGQEIADSLEKPLNDAVSDSNQYGADFVDGLANGMQGKVGVLSYAANTLANAIRNVLHFSRPDEGPLKEYEQWMPDMVKGLSRGIYDNLWRIEDASTEVASRLAAPQMIANYNGGINIAVNAAQGQSANEVANAVMVKIQEATNRRNAVWA